MRKKKSEIDEMMRGQFDAMKERYWLALLADLMALHMQEAFRTDQLGLTTRRDIFDRVMGRAQEEQRNEAAPQITINIASISALGEERQVIEIKAEEKEIALPAPQPIKEEEEIKIRLL